MHRQKPLPKHLQKKQRQKRNLFCTHDAGSVPAV